jgi:general secretion pathway protein G
VDSPRYAIQKRPHQGFSLVELLAALAAAGILASAGVSLYSGQSERVRVNEAVAEISRIQLAIAVFESDAGNIAAGLPGALSELDIDPSLLTDPWGRPYQYLRLDSAAAAATARTDGNDRPLNRDYDLFSLGRNGASEPSIADSLAADDIVRGAGGGYVGKAAEYGAIGGAATGQFTNGTGAAGGATAGAMDPRRGS